MRLLAAAAVFALLACSGPSPTAAPIPSPAELTFTTEVTPPQPTIAPAATPSPKPAANATPGPSRLPTHTAVPLPTPAPLPAPTPASTRTPTPALVPTSVPASTPPPIAGPTPQQISTPTLEPPLALTPTQEPKAAAQPAATSIPPATLASTPTLLGGPPGSTTRPVLDETANGGGAAGQGVHLIADGRTDTYSLISSVLGENPIEHPDCAHPAFGPHITQEWDNDLEKHSFVFHIHVSPDNDRCQTFDRQRTEIKTYSSSPKYLKGFLGETVTYRWIFKLDEGFQPSANFTHIHQLKDVGGNISSPIITLTPRIGSPDRIEIRNKDSAGISTLMATAPLEPFKGVWIEVYERMTYGHDGSYSIELRSLSTGALILAHDDPNIDLWRFGAEFVRPKWGIYRSLKSQEYLRDEQVRFDQFCLAKGSDDCP